MTEYMITISTGKCFVFDGTHILTHFGKKYDAYYNPRTKIKFKSAELQVPGFMGEEL